MSAQLKKQSVKKNPLASLASLTPNPRYIHNTLLYKLLSTGLLSCILQLPSLQAGREYGIGSLHVEGSHGGESHLVAERDRATVDSQSYLKG